KLCAPLNVSEPLVNAKLPVWFPPPDNVRACALVGREIVPPLLTVGAMLLLVPTALVIPPPVKMSIVPPPDDVIGELSFRLKTAPFSSFSLPLLLMARPTPPEMKLIVPKLSTTALSMTVGEPEPVIGVV